MSAPDRQATAVEWRAKLRDVLLKTFDKWANDTDGLYALDALSHVGRHFRLPKTAALRAAIMSTGAPHPLFAKYQEALSKVLDRPEVRSQVRQLAADPKHAKRFKHVLEMVQRYRPEVFTEPETGPPQPDTADDLGKYRSRGSVRFTSRSVTVTTKADPARSRSIPSKRGKRTPSPARSNEASG